MSNSAHFAADVISYDSSTHRARVRYAGTGPVVIPCLASCPTLLAGDVVAVVLHDGSNPEDGAVLGPFGGARQNIDAILTDSNGDPLADANGNLITE